MITTDFPSPSDAEREFLLRCGAAEVDLFFERCGIYGKYLYETNETLNLTRIPPEDFWSKHVCDSLSAALALPEIVRGTLCDVGCGPGLPSVILAAAFPDLSVLAMDSRGKKTDFVAEAARRMGLKNLKTVHARANEAGRTAEFRSRFQFVTARAVADALSLRTETQNLLARKGRLVIYRTRAQAEEEIPELEKRHLLFHLTEEFTLPGDKGKRMFLILG